MLVLFFSKIKNMATIHKNLSDYNKTSIPNASKMKFAIVVAEWNDEITNALCSGAVDTLLKHGAKKTNIIIHYVPGTVELTLGAQLVSKKADAILCLGCVIKGETPHFDYVCKSATYGITELNIKHNKPFIFGVLTTNNLQEAKDRAGGKHGNKGDEAAITAIKMLALKKNLSTKK